jgi:Zn-dependent peptidase ImmA (M78 family)
VKKNLKTISKSKVKSSIKIGGYVFAVKYVADLKDDQGQPLHGETDTSTRVIKINTNDSHDMQAQTLFHECLHAALYVTGQASVLSEAAEEGIVLAIDHMLWPLLKELSDGR